MTVLVLSQNGRGPQQFDRYRNAISSRVARVTASADDSNNFDCRIRSQKIGPLQLVEISSDAVVLHRSAKCIALDPSNHYIVSLQASGHGLIRHDRAEVPLTPGSLVLLDKSQPYETKFHDHASRLLICIPRFYLERRLGDASRFVRMAAVQTEKGIAHIAATYARSLLQEADHLDVNSKANAAAVCLDLIATTLLSASGDACISEDVADQRGRSAVVLLSRIKAYVRASLATPDLDPKVIAGAHGISKRYLHALFSTTGMSVSAFIREERLTRAYLDLSNPRLRDLSVTEIVLHNGFNDVPNFTRRFKIRYGVTPNAVRKDHDAHGQ